MAYKLNSIVNIPKYKGKTVQECIDNYLYAFNAMINKNSQWYDQEVLEYLEEANYSNASSHKNSKLLDRDYKKVLQRDNT